MITNIILVIILLLIAGGAGMYLYKAKKRGEHCIGCPYAKQCGPHKCGRGKARETKGTDEEIIKAVLDAGYGVSAKDNNSKKKIEDDTDGFS